MRSATVTIMALSCLVVAPAADGAVRAKADQRWGVRFVLDGERLTVKATERRESRSHARVQLEGGRVVAACGTSVLPRRGATVRRARGWRAGAGSVVFRFRRDISRRAQWCALARAGSRRGGDRAEVSFLRSESRQRLARGRASGGGWWRLLGWRGAWLEPCIGLDVPDASARSCRRALPSRGVVLTASIYAPTCPGETFVFGLTARSVASIVVVRRDGVRVEAKLLAAPAGSRWDAQYYVAVLPGVVDLHRVVASDAEGRMIAHKTVPAGWELRCGSLFFH